MQFIEFENAHLLQDLNTQVRVSACCFVFNVF